MNYDEILQQFIIKLRIDGVDLTKSTDAINKDLDKLEKNTGKTQGRFKQLAAQTNQFGKEGADAFAAVRREALSYFAIITGGRGLTSFIRDTTKAGVSLDNLSRQLGISRQNLLQYRYALEAVGSDGGGYEKLLSRVQSLSRSYDGRNKIRDFYQQSGVNLINRDGSVKSDILDQLHNSSVFQKRARSVQSGILEGLGANPDILNLVDSPRYKSIVNSPEFQGVGQSEELIQQNRRLLEDWIKFQAESSKIFNRVYSDIQPVADGIIRGLTAIESSHPRAVATGLEYLAGAISTLGIALAGIGLVKTGGKILGALGLGKAGKLAWKGVKAGIKTVAGGEAAATAAGEAASIGAIEEAAVSVGGISGGPLGALIGLGIGTASVAGYEAYQHIKPFRNGVDWLSNHVVGAGKQVFDWGVRANKIRDILDNGGFKNLAGLGVLARFQLESGLDPRAIGDGGKAFGIGQWRGSRLDDFKRLFGYDIRESSLEDQAHFAVWELKNTERTAAQALLNAKSPAEAGAAASLLYERPKNKQIEAERTGQLAEKISANLNASTGNSAQTNHFNVTLGDINVTSHAANPAHVANEVNASTSGHLKATLDEFRKAIVQQNAGGIY